MLTTEAGKKKRNKELFITQGTIELFGIRRVNINAREIVGAAGSKIVVSSPNWNQQYKTPTLQTGKNGDDGNHGIEGPQGE